MKEGRVMGLQDIALDTRRIEAMERHNKLGKRSGRGNSAPYKDAFYWDDSYLRGLDLQGRSYE